MEKKMSNTGFRMMIHVGMPIRNLFMPPEKMLAEVEVKPGYKVLDYGCGPGTFTILMAERVGPSGIVYALDIHPLAIASVERKARKRHLANIRTILSGCSTSLPDNSLDVILFFDVLHALDHQQEVLVELHRVLASNGTMCFSDHHMKEVQIQKGLTEKRLFMLRGKGRRTYLFQKVK